jgi:DinB family protein
MQSVAHEILSLIKDAAKQLIDIPEETASVRPAPGKWSKKEILGHLIDSASNNHQRFVRLQLSERVELPGYAQDDWVRVQRYQDQPWQQIIAVCGHRTTASWQR